MTLSGVKDCTVSEVENIIWVWSVGGMILMV